MRREIVPASQSPVERLCARAEVHELDHGMGEEQRGHHPGGQLVRVVGLGDHEYDDEQILRVYEHRGDPAVHLPEQHGQSGIVVVVLGYEQARHLYQSDVRPQVLDEAVFFVTHDGAGLAAKQSAINVTSTVWKCSTVFPTRAPPAVAWLKSLGRIKHVDFKRTTGKSQNGGQRGNTIWGGRRVSPFRILPVPCLHCHASPDPPSL